MNPVVLNRVLIVLGVIGLGVAGMLSFAELLNREIPCTAGGGCAAVANHPSSRFAGIPIAVIGLGGYFILTALALFRAFTGQERATNPVAAGYLVSAIGLASSAYLQYISLTQIKARCIWCITSAIIMLTTFVLHILLAKTADNQPTDTPNRGAWPTFGGIAAVVAVLGTFAYSTRLPEDYGTAKEVKLSDLDVLIPKARNQTGDDKAPITIVEFADFACGSCRTSFKYTEKLLLDHPGKFRLIYRHMPLPAIPGHEMSALVAAVSECAAEQGKFWNFARMVMNLPEPAKTADEVRSIARAAGVDMTRLDRLLSDESPEPMKRLERDVTAAADQLGVKGTPTYFVIIDGKVRMADAAGFVKMMGIAEVKAILDKK